ncbi:phage tail protein [Clostridium botulinum]|uniref:phage tail protein n=1 Tax=Clostridium botulinum TaxID=1491 RepID=UPI003DA66A3D
MAEKFYTILTKVGKAKIANATALGNKVNFTTLKVGDGGGKYYNPTEEQEDLVNEVWQGNINSIRVDENNPNWVVIEVIIPSSVGGFMIREAGVFDDENNMLAIGKYPETYKPQAQDGSTKDLVIRTNLEISNTSSVTLKVDPTVILATQKDIQILDDKIKNIKVPVTKVNEKIGDIVLTASDIKTENGQTVEAQLADITKDSYLIVEATGINNYVGNNAKITVLEKGTKFTLFVANNATGTCYINVNGFGNKVIRDSFNNTVNNLKSNIPYNLCYNGSSFILQGKGGGGNLQPNQALKGFTFTNDAGPQIGLGDNNLKSENIVNGVNIFGVTGNVRKTSNIPKYFQNLPSEYTAVTVAGDYLWAKKGLDNSTAYAFNMNGQLQKTVHYDYNNYEFYFATTKHLLWGKVYNDSTDCDITDHNSNHIVSFNVPVYRPMSVGMEIESQRIYFFRTGGPYRAYVYNFNGTLIGSSSMRNSTEILISPTLDGAYYVNNSGYVTFISTTGAVTADISIPANALFNGVFL